MRYIRLYKDLSIDNGTLPFHVFKSYPDFLNAIASHQVNIYQTETYRINGENVLRLNLGDFASSAPQITYAIESDDGITNYFRFFFVNSYKALSGYHEFQLMPDLWATYISRAKIDRIVVSRSNKNVGNGVFDDVQNITVDTLFEDAFYESIGGEEHSVKGLGYLPLDKVAICFTASVVTGQSLVFPEEHVQSVYAFGTTLDVFDTLFVDTGQVPESIVERAVRLVSGINGVVAGGGVKLGISINKIFLMPISFLSFENWGYKFSSKATFGSGEITYRALKFGLKEQLVLFPRSKLDINKKWYFGTRFDGMPVERSTVDEIGTIRCFVNADGLQVDLTQGDRVQSITHAFEVSAIGSSVVPDSLQRLANVARGIQGLIKDLSGIASSKTKGEAVTKGASTLLGYTEVLGERAKAGQGVSNSEGTVTFDAGLHEWQGKKYVFNPFYFRFYSSSIDESKKALLTGASFNVVLSSLDDLKTVDFVVPNGVDDLPFVMATARVSGVPMEAQAVIENALKGGVFLAFD